MVAKEEVDQFIILKFPEVLISILCHHNVDISNFLCTQFYGIMYQILQCCTRSESQAMVPYNTISHKIGEIRSYSHASQHEQTHFNLVFYSNVYKSDMVLNMLQISLRICFQQIHAVLPVTQNDFFDQINEVHM